MTRAPEAPGEGAAGKAALVACNVAGMVDLVVLPLWIGALIASRGLGPQAAGATVACYIAGVFASSVALAPRFGRLDARRAAASGFACGAAAFAAMTLTDGVAATAALHLIAGLGAGCGLSATHGAIARTANPHRTFSLAGLGVGVFAILFFAAGPAVIAAHGAAGMFLMLAALLAVGAASAAAAFPTSSHPAPTLGRLAPRRAAPSLRMAAAFCAVVCLATNQAMIFGFIERIGVGHGFTLAQVGTALLIGGVVNLSAPMLAAALQGRLSPFAVSGLAIPLHGCVGALITVTGAYAPWAAESVLFVWLILFGHNFIFGVIARLDPSGRTAASTPAMLMLGSAFGPLLGGTLAEAYGLSSLGPAALVIAGAGALCFAVVWRGASSSRQVAPA